MELFVVVLCLALLASLSLNVWFIRRAWARFIFRA
ncbi:hypothetical protein B0I28_1068 [Glycomyces artemisiae]|uniref:Uncharacterized protein n=1 Tax=Glycomyces artemisiae TaxID=1076443 RepID=A0A2T0UI91_9ACTN|nr:hypothetical protein B0I28_1068 [Glycomyces artemisiae]